MNKIILKAENIDKTYKEGNILTPVLKAVNLEIFENEMVAIVGKSGSGKSTLLHILGTLDSLNRGSVKFMGKELTALTPKQQAEFRNKSLGFIYQFHHLLGDFSALENVMMPLLIAGENIDKARDRAEECLKQVGLERRFNFKPGEMSGGERQRTAIARAFCNHPRLILADEPTGNLDAKNAAEVFALFERLTRSEHTSVVMVTHDVSLAKRCDKIYTMRDGTVDAN